MPNSLNAFLFLVTLLASCGDTSCPTCRSDDACGVGEVCLPAPGGNTCARMCSLVVWEVGPGYEVPCAAGVDGCPETCNDADGVFGHCTARAGLPAGVGVCIEPTGALVCP